MKYTEKELENLKSEILGMWSLVYSQLQRAGESLLALDKDLAAGVVIREKRVNALELRIDSMCEDIIALYTPVAVDLRFVLAMLKINTNLERIADFADGMARFVRDYPTICIDAELIEKTELKQMLENIKQMLFLGKDALEKESSMQAASIFELDNQVDIINRASTDIIAAYVAQYPDRAKECLLLSNLIRKMERIGDHCNNLAEEVIFYLDAKVLKHAKNSEA